MLPVPSAESDTTTGAGGRLLNIPQSSKRRTWYDRGYFIVGTGSTRFGLKDTLNDVVMPCLVLGYY
jgi:hypothetical protein